MLIVICINLRLISFYDNMSTTKIRRKQTILLNIHTITLGGRESLKKADN